jgi:opacity protein-like surface antigen
MTRIESRRWVAAMTLAMALIAAPAVAQTTTAQPAPQPAGPSSFRPLGPDTGGWTLTPFIGVDFSGDFNNSPAAFGAAFGHGVNSHVSLEAEAAVGPNGRQGLLTDIDSTVFTLSGNVLYHFTGQQDFSPYVTVGLGVMNVDTDAEKTGLTNDGTSFGAAWNVGGGIKTALSNRIGLRGDIRYFNAVDDLAPDHWRVYGGLVIRRILG